MQKDKVLVKGRIVKMSDAAFKIASKHFGARRNKPEEDYPAELKKVPRLDIVSALKTVTKTEEKPVEEVKPPEVKLEEVKPIEEVKEVKAEVKKVTRKRK